MNEKQSTNIDLTQLAEQAKAASTKELTALIEHHQEQLIERLCGPRHSRGQPYKRSGTYTKKLVTTHGAIKLKVTKVKNRSSGRAYSPTLEALDALRRRYSRAIRWACVEHASRMSYGMASDCYHAVTGIKVPRRTIHRWINELAPSLLEKALI